MRIEVFVAPHERSEAIDAYGRYLSDEQAEEIENAKEGWIKLDIDMTGGHTIVWYQRNDKWETP
jgi:hypothetical protein